MSDFQLSLRGDRTNFRPDEKIEGSAGWNLAATPTAIEIRLLWFTRGKGTSDACIVEKTAIAAPATMGDAPFRFVLPAAPHSFSGQLIALVWAVEIVAFGPKNRPLDSQRLEFQLSPSENAIVLERVNKPMTALEAKIAARAEKWKTKRGNHSGFSDL